MKAFRSADNYYLAGVCGGLAEFLGWSPSRLRLVWLLATLLTAAFPGIVLYLVLYWLMPRGEPSTH
jgi:phage shock protein C